MLMREHLGRLKPVRKGAFAADRGVLETVQQLQAGRSLKVPEPARVWGGVCVCGGERCSRCSASPAAVRRQTRPPAGCGYATRLRRRRQRVTHSRSWCRPRLPEVYAML